MASSNKPRRADHDGAHRTAFQKAKAKILATQDICAYCGRPVDKSLKFPNPWCATVDHIIPISLGGHPSAIENLQLMHYRCNLLKGTQATKLKESLKNTEEIGNDDLPQSMDWSKYRPGQF